MSDDSTVTKSTLGDTRWQKKSREFKIRVYSQLAHFVRFVPYCTKDTENYIHNSQMPITIDYPHKKNRNKRNFQNINAAFSVWTCSLLISWQKFVRFFCSAVLLFTVLNVCAVIEWYGVGTEGDNVLGKGFGQTWGLILTGKPILSSATKLPFLRENPLAYDMSESYPAT